MKNIKHQFPIYRRKLASKPLVYLDSAATALKPKAVIDSICQYYRDYSANIHRGLYPTSIKATAAYEAARETVANFIGADRGEIIFVRGATEGINLLAATLGQLLLEGKQSARIVTSEMEHHANLVPWQMAARNYQAELVAIPIKNYQFDLTNIQTLINSKTKIVALTLASNVLGTINDLRLISRRAKQVGALTVVDAAQAVPHIPVDVKKLDCDFLVFSGHKLYGPTGIGVLWGKKQWLEKMPPYQFGGDMIETVTFKGATWAKSPQKFEAGTPNIAGAVGLGEAVKYIKSLGFRWIIAHERELTSYALSRLTTVDGITIYGLPANQSRIGVISFSIKGIHPHDLAELLGRENIAVRAGFHCAQPLVEKICRQPIARISFGVYSTKSDIDQLVEALNKIVKKFK